ncbi:MAG: hypothetical protein DCC65_03340 [Planctomycetota bacterium]|nr:MAG: hypothetical protein DCC65_03340 [Planctomycetota bacterium]
MTGLVERRVPLGALSCAQRRVVERYLWLASAAVRKTCVVARANRAGREFRDLWQEGALALAEAVRTHDPARHGDFAPYALARIRFSVSRYAQENSCAIRVPYITQRRRRARLRASELDESPGEGTPPPAEDPSPSRDTLNNACVGDGQDGAGGGEDEELILADVPARRWEPALLPRVVNIGCGSPHPRRAHGRHDPDARAREGARQRRLEEVMGPAIREAVRKLKSTPGRSADYRRMIELCAAERWLIPEPEAKLPIRELARRLGCSIGRITRCEERFRREAAGALRERGV